MYPCTKDVPVVSFFINTNFQNVDLLIGSIKTDVFCFLNVNIYFYFGFCFCQWTRESFLREKKKSPLALRHTIFAWFASA